MIHDHERSHQATQPADETRSTSGANLQPQQVGEGLARHWHAKHMGCGHSGNVKEKVNKERKYEPIAATQNKSFNLKSIPIISFSQF